MEQRLRGADLASHACWLKSLVMEARNEKDTKAAYSLDCVCMHL